MKYYKTVEEIATELNVSYRHIQYLCKKGDITGAVKKAGVWFIPEDSSIPVKNTKHDSEKFKFIGTKKKIFENSILLFEKNGYENVSVRDIANSVQIHQSAVYNHFNSKKEILEEVYDYCRYYYVTHMMDMQDVRPILRNGSIMDILKCTLYDLSSEYMQGLLGVLKIVFQRSFFDEEAREIIQTIIIENGKRFTEKIFSMAVNIQRIAPVDIKEIVVFINIIRTSVFYSWITGSLNGNQAIVYEAERLLDKYSTLLITDLKPNEEQL